MCAGGPGSIPGADNLDSRSHPFESVKGGVTRIQWVTAAEDYEVTAGTAIH